MALDSTGSPRPDPTGAALDQIRELTEADMAATGVEIAEDGTIGWKR
jgi:hypothetical protein